MQKLLYVTLLSAIGITMASAQTIYNGDKIDGVPVITKLDTNDLAQGKIYRFMFKGVDMNIGQSWHVPVVVAKGTKKGPKLLLNTGIHGDEMNGSRIVQNIFESLDPKQLNGTVVGVLQASPNSLTHITRTWHLSTDGGFSEDMNRQFPGKENGNTAQVQAYKLFNNLYLGNADYAIDLHTQSTDTVYPLFMYADYRIPAVKHLAELIPADQIKIDTGEDDVGALENALDKADIPTITLEIGEGRIYQPDLINRAVQGINNVLIDNKMIKGTLGQTARTYNTYIANDMVSVRAKAGGYAEVFVKVGDDVKVGQKIALQRNPFGDVIKEYTAPVAGKVASIGTGATRENGGLLVRIITQNPDPKCKYGC